jgi:hypothetical protein
VKIDSIAYIGKESNRLEEVEEQSALDPNDTYTEYPDPRRDEWSTKVLPVLKKMPVSKLMAETGLSRATIQAIRAGRRPHPKNQHVLTPVATANKTLGDPHPGKAPLRARYEARA